LLKNFQLFLTIYICIKFSITFRNLFENALLEQRQVGSSWGGEGVEVARTSATER
jgi:hypothetical protein